jgi:hypothetical protein
MLDARHLASGALWLLACSSAAPPPSPASPTPSAGLHPLTRDQTQRLVDGGVLYWRHGEICEPWQIHVDPDDPARGRLARPEGASVFSYTFTIRDGYFTLSAPHHEADDRATSLPCTYDGLIERRRGAPQITLHAYERWYTELAACERGDPPAHRPLGCASALADPHTKARLTGRGAPPLVAGAPSFLRRSARARAVYWLRSGPTGPRCERWRSSRPRPEHPAEGRLHRQIGDRLVTLEYAVDGAWLTLAGPAWTSAHDPPRLGARSCLHSRPITGAAADHLLFTGGAWYLDARACERAREGAGPLAAPPCLELSAPDGSGTARSPAPPA